MEVVKAFNNELSSLYETRPPISKAKMTAVTRSGIKAIKFYKHVVQSVEKFIQKCKPEYKVPGLYVIDSIVRQSRHQFTPEKDVFAPRFARNIQQTFLHLFNCPPEDKGKIVRVLNLWQKNQVFTPDVVQPLLDMASLANKDQLVVPPNSNGVQMPPTSTQPRTPTTKPSPVKDPSWLTPSVDLSSTPAQPVPTPAVNTKLPTSTGMIDPNIMQQLQNLQNLLLDKQMEANNMQNKKDDTVKFDKKLLDYDYEEDDDDPPSPQQPPQPTPPLPSIDSLQTILSNPEVLRQLQTLQQQMSSRQQQAEMEDKMRRLQEMRHQEEEFDKHLAQTLPNLPFASECDFKPSSSANLAEGMSPGTLAAASQQTQSSQSLGHPDSVSAVNFPTPISAPPAPFGVGIGDSDERSGATDFDERNRAPPGLSSTGNGGGGVIPINVDETSWDSKHGNTTQTSGDAPIEIIDLIRTDSPVKSPSRSSRRRRSPSPRRSRRSKSRSRSRSRRRRSRTRTRSRSRSRSKSREDRERERERRRRGLPPMKKNHLAVCSTTLWIGHLSKLVQQEELSDTFGEFGDIVSINLIPPRGCAFICMNRRQDAAKALQQLKHFKLQGKAITIAWAPGKGMKDKEWKDYWEVEHGVSYIPWNKLSVDTDLDMLEDGGVIDEDSLPEFIKAKRNVVKHDYATHMQQQQAQLMAKVSEDKNDLAGDETKSRSDMNIGNVASNTAVPPSYIPLPDNSLGGAGGPPGAQPPPGIPPPMGLLPPFALPPLNSLGLLGPMGPMGPLGMGNVPLGVPPPLMMPPPPQQMVGRLPPPFNPPPQMGLMPPPTISASGDNIDKSKMSQMPPPPTPETFPDLSSMVNPFGIPLPTIPNFGNTNLLSHTQPPVTQPAVNKISSDMDVDVKENKSEAKELKPPISNVPATTTSTSSLNDNTNSSDRASVKDLERASSGMSGVGTGSGSGSGTGGGSVGSVSPGGGTSSISLGKKDCDWRDTSPRRRDRNEREEKRRRRESPPPRRDERRGDDRRVSAAGAGVEDRRNDDRRAGADRRMPSSRWQSRQNKWQDDKDRHDRRSTSPYKDSFAGGRSDKDERPSAHPLPPHQDQFHQGGMHHDQHYRQNPMSHHEQYQQGLSKGPPSHHDQHYQQALAHEQQYQQGPLKAHHDQHYQGHDQQYQQMGPSHFRQHDQLDYPQSPPLGYGRYPESERDEMMGHQNAEYPPPRGYFNRGHVRMPPPRSPRPLLRTPNGPMFGPRGPPMGGPCPPPPMSLRGHRPGLPGNRMEGPGFMPPRGFPPPGIRGRGAGGRFPGAGSREEWEGLSRRRGWEEYPPNHPGHLGPPGHMVHGGPPGLLGPPPLGHGGPPGPKSILGGPPGGPPHSLLGSPAHLRMPSPGNLERRKSRWSTAPETKSESQQQQQEQQITSSQVNPPEESFDKASENISSEIVEGTEEMNTQADTTEVASSDAQPNFGESVAEGSSEPQASGDSQPSQVSYEKEEEPQIHSYDEKSVSSFEQPAEEKNMTPFDQPPSTNVEMNVEVNMCESPAKNGQPNVTNRRLSFDNFQQSQCNDPAQNLYGDEVLPITYEQPQTSQMGGNDEEEAHSTSGADIISDRYADDEMKVDAPIFDIQNTTTTDEKKDTSNVEEEQL